jgi:hypothetical protein
VGQDGEVRPGRGRDMTGQRRPAARAPFSQEIRTALRYERGLALKVVVALAVVAALALAHVYLFA